MEFIRERDSNLNHPDSHSRLQNIDDLTDMGFNITEFIPIPTIGDMVPQTPAGSRTNTTVPTSTPRPNGGSHLNNSDHNRENTHSCNSFTSIAGRVEPQKSARSESNDKPMGSNNSASTGNTTLFYPGEISSKPKEQVYHHGSM